MIRSILYGLLTGVALLCLLTSCLFNDENLFDETAAQRLNNTITHTEEVLKSAGNGWVMEYFPNKETEGYTFLMKFRADGIAEVASLNKYTPQYTVNKGTWNVIGDNGPVLTFNTYIDNFHLFSNPKQPSSNYYDGGGLLGDYEFVILHTDTDTIRLKGKKRGTDIRLKRLATDRDWENYLLTLKKMDQTLFSERLAINWTLNAEGKTYTLTNGASHIFTVQQVEVSENEEEDEETGSDLAIPFIITDYGFRLAQVLEYDGISVQSFKLSDDKTYLYALENEKVRITTTVSPFTFFLDESVWNGGISWNMDKENLGGSFATAYAGVLEGCKTAFKEDFNDFFFQYKPGRRSKTFSFKSGNKYEGAYDFDIVPKSETNNEIVFSNKGTMDNNGKVYHDRIAGFQEILYLLSKDSFTLTVESPLCPSVIRFTSINDPGNWFSVTAY